MLASYLTDIEQLLDEQRWDAALREACDLPRIAVALSDPELRCSGDAVGMWCRQWIPPLPDAPAAQDILGHSRYRASRQAHRARLRSPFPPARCAACSCGATCARRPVASPVTGTRILIRSKPSRSRPGAHWSGAARRWYARSGCHDPTVQTNLARLAVLR